MNDYSLLLEKLPNDKWFIAKEVNLAAATLNAMERRGLIQVNRSVKPMQYRKQLGLEKHSKVMKALNECLIEKDIAYLGYNNRNGILCEYKKDKGGWCDYSGKPLTSDMTMNVVEVYAYKNGEKIRSFKIE